MYTTCSTGRPFKNFLSSLFLIYHLHTACWYWRWIKYVISLMSSFTIVLKAILNHSFQWHLFIFVDVCVLDDCECHVALMRSEDSLQEFLLFFPSTMLITEIECRSPDLVARAFCKQLPTEPGLEPTIFHLESQLYLFSLSTPTAIQNTNKAGCSALLFSHLQQDTPWGSLSCSMAAGLTWMANVAFLERQMEHAHSPRAVYTHPCSSSAGTKSSFPLLTWCRNK